MIDGTVLAAQSLEHPPVLLNEFNAVSKAGWDRNDPKFEHDRSNGGDWMELLIADPGSAAGGAGDRMVGRGLR